MDTKTIINNVKLKDNLIILSGSPRGGDLTWKSMIKNLKSPLNADLAVSYGNKFHISEYLSSHIDYDWIFTEPKNWREYLEQYYSENLINFFIKGVENGLAGIDGLKGSGAIVFSLIDLVYRDHYETINKYENVIYTRFDQFYFMELDYNLENKIYIPEGEDYFGINDRFIIIPNKAYEDFFSICTYIENVYSKKDYEFLNTNSVLNEHIKFLSEKFEIVRTKRNMVTVATSEDETRWRTPEYKLFFKKDLMIKYPGEFMSTMKNLIQHSYSPKSYVYNIPSLIQYFYLNLRIKLGQIKKRMGI